MFQKSLLKYFNDIVNLTTAHSIVNDKNNNLDEVQTIENV